jgi:hypothetical protein
MIPFNLQKPIRRRTRQRISIPYTDDYFNLMVIDVSDEMTYKMIHTESTVSVEQIHNIEVVQKMMEYINNNWFAKNERVILRKFNAIFTEFIPYFKKLIDFPKVAFVAYFKKRNNFYKYALHVLRFIQQKMFPEIGVEVKLGVENLWFFLTPYIRDWCKVHYISKEMMSIPSDVEEYIRERYKGSKSQDLKHPPFKLDSSFREELDFK